MRRIFEVFFSFTGRMSRGFWWAATIVLNLCALALVTAFNVFVETAEVHPYVAGLRAHAQEMSTISSFDAAVELSAALYLVCVPLMSCAVNAKRFHDRDKSGWWSLVAFVPIFGPVWVLVDCGLLPGTARSNRFGSENIIGQEARLFRSRARRPRPPYLDGVA